LVFAALTLVASDLTLAGKPVGGGGGSVPAGRIFYSWSTAINPNVIPDPDYEHFGFWSMNADGSDKQLLAYQPKLSAQLSHQFHLGHRWFLEFGPSPTPGNGAAVFAVRDDGDPDFTVLLADPPGLSLGSFRWAKDDSMISITALAEITNPNGTKGYDPNAVEQIYAAMIAFNSDTGLPELVTPFVAVGEGETPGYPDIITHDWSGDGSEIVYQQEPNGEQPSAKIVNLATGEKRLLAERAYSPVWSPDGSRIAYKLFNDAIYAVNPDGTGLLKISSNSSDLTAGWSPDSQYVLLNRLIVKSIKGGYQEYHSDVLRVPAGGGKAVNLTSDIDGYARSAFWR
jgi:hypothetical protein